MYKLGGEMDILEEMAKLHGGPVNASIRVYEIMRHRDPTNVGQILAGEMVEKRLFSYEKLQRAVRREGVGLSEIIENEGYDLTRAENDAGATYLHFLNPKDEKIMTVIFEPEEAGKFNY